MNAELEAIKDSWDKETGDGRNDEGTRILVDQYVANHPEEFTEEIRNMDLEQCIRAISAFRRAGMEESQWRMEVWQLHHFEPQVIGGTAKVRIRVPGQVQNG